MSNRPIDFSAPPAPGPNPVTRLPDQEQREILLKHLSYSEQCNPDIVKFIFAYVETLDAGSAGLSVRGGKLTKASARMWGKKMARRPSIHRAISELLDLTMSDVRIHKPELIEKVKNFLDFDMANFFDDKGKFIHPNQLPPEVSASIKDFKVREMYGSNDGQDWKYIRTEIFDIKGHERLTAAKMLGSEVDAFTEKKKIEISRKEPSKYLEEAKARANARMAEYEKIKDIKPLEDE